MLIGVCGTRCAGKSLIQDFLIKEHGFIPLSIERPKTTNTQWLAPTPTPELQPQPQTFPTVEALLDFATQSWQTNYCTTSIHTTAIAETLSHRPWFLLIHVDAPLTTRHNRYVLSCGPTPRTDTFEAFVHDHETSLYKDGAASLASHAHLQLLNTAPSLAALHSALRNLNLPNPDRLRPTWDHYFMTLASLASRRSNCMRRRVGCVLVRGNRVLSTGYNGTPRNVPNCNSGGCPRCNNTAASSSSGGASLATCLCLHAEENALLEAGRERIGNGREAVLYCDTCPCLTCCVKIVQVGIGEVVFSKGYYMDEASQRVFELAGVRCRQFSPVREGLVVLGEVEWSNERVA